MVDRYPDSSKGQVAVGKWAVGSGKGFYRKVPRPGVGDLLPSRTCCWTPTPICPQLAWQISRDDGSWSPAASKQY